MAVSETGRTAPALLAVRNTGCLPRVPPDVEPTAMTAPPAPTVALATDSAPVSPSDPVGSQVPPVPVLV
jgi:hypothetical protein